MAFGLTNAIMLIGLIAVAIPIIIHLLNRRRFDVVDWGAMQFLQVSEVTRRKVFIEELLLMLLRMGLIAILVLGMALPFAVGSLFDRLGLGDNRDVVLVLDGSTGMSLTDDDNKSIQDKAVEWCKDLLDKMSPGDNVAVLQAREQVVFVVPQLSSDHKRIRKELDKLAAPRGVCDWPQAVETAEALLKNSGRSRREIILVGDGRKAGWSDERTLRRWELLAPQLPQGDAGPRLWAVPLGRTSSEPVPNWSLTSLRSGRARASTTLDFRSTVKVAGQKYEPPYSMRFRVDQIEEPTDTSQIKGSSLPLPSRDDLRDGRLPLTFSHTFEGPGAHLVTLIVEPDSPERKKDKTQIGVPIKDRVAGDNRQDFAVMLPLLPVLLVDGLAPEPGKYRGADFLQVALAPARDKSRLVRARVVPLEELTAALSRDIGPEANTKPRVVVLCDVPRLADDQRETLTQFVNAGGGLLVTHGPRSDLTWYNKELYRGGLGLLPTILDEPNGNEDDPYPTDGVTPDPAAHPLPASFTHAALDLFRGNLSGGLGNARFPRWWKLARPEIGSPSLVVAELTTKYPWMLEKQVGKGRVIQCAVAMDDSWNTNLHRLEVPEFPLLAFELVAYLAGARGIEFNLTPGQPLIYQPLDDESKERATLRPPQGEPVELEGKGDLFVHKDTRLPGVYSLTTSRNRTIYYVVHPDPRGSDDFTPATEAEREQVKELVKLDGYTQDVSQVLAASRQDLWWWLMLGVIGLLCGEVWLTGRIVKGR